MAKPFLTEHAGHLSLIIALVSGFVVAVALADMSTGSLGLDGWSAYLLVAGLIAFVVAIIWLAQYLRTVRDLKALLDENRKAVFVRSVDDAEYLAWKLPMKYEKELAAKKRSFGLK
jgi:MFS family permease